MIYINGRFLTRPMTGVERYAYNLCRALSTLSQPVTIICPQAPIQDCYDTSGLHIVRYGRGSSHFWEQCVLPFFFLGKRRSLLVCFTGLGSILVRHKVMTIHDLSFLENPRWFSRPYYWWYKVMTPLAVRTSRRIVTVSQFSKQEILRFYPFLRPDHIHVIYGAANLKPLPQQTSPLPSQGENLRDQVPFLLAVSSLDPRKNFNSLIEAFQDIKECQLRIVGSYNRAFNAQTSNLKPQTSNLKILGRVSDAELVRLYSSASFFIFPSLYEGFGLPPIEAMSCGSPVLASDIPVLREVCGDAAIYFRPTDINDIRRAVRQALSLTPADREKLLAAGYKNASRFSWEKSAKAMINLVQEISSH